jgi:hypothetical protein
VTDSCEHGNGSSVSIKDGEFDLAERLSASEETF